MLLLLLAVAAVPIGTAGAIGWVRGEHAPPPLPPPPEERRGFASHFDVKSFLKGNLHTHTLRSDGDSAPEEVIQWYRAQGYRFLALTDHNRFTSSQLFGSMEDEHFHILSGEEVTMKGAGRQVHVNALCTSRKIGGGTFPSAAAALAWAIGQVESQNGVAIVNHPNFDHGLEPVDLLAASGASLLEVMSGHPYVYSLGTKGRPPHEAFWDFALTEHVGFMGVAVDDTHHLRVNADPPAYPGRGWVQVFTDQDDETAICNALRAGQLYASSGVELERIQVTDNRYTVWPSTDHTIVSFIGSGGVELGREGPLPSGRPATYALRPQDRYVRAKITGREGAVAWTPAVFTTTEIVARR